MTSDSPDRFEPSPQQKAKQGKSASKRIALFIFIGAGMPEAYDDKYKHWNVADLPIFPTVWKIIVKKESKDLFDNIKTLLKKADTVVNAGDCDREGQLLIDEILDYCGYKGKVLRILISDTNPEAVKMALDNLKPDSDFHGDRDAALARSRADWLHGITLISSECFILNTTASVPRGLWLKLDTLPKKGDFVLVPIDAFSSTEWVPPEYFRKNMRGKRKPFLKLVAGSNGDTVELGNNGLILINGFPFPKHDYSLHALSLLHATSFRTPCGACAQSL